jgi:DNA-binding transcriptional LysR family regulator
MTSNMKPGAVLDKIDLQLIRTLHTLITQRSVSRAALELGQQQPAVSLALRRLRQLTGDAILVRSGANMVPTERALQLLEPTRQLLDVAQQVFAVGKPFNPASDHRLFRIAASDTLDPGFLPKVVERVRQAAPLCPIEIHALSPNHQYASDLAEGQLDLVVGNWAAPPGHLHRAHLFEDEVVCLVSRQHPFTRQAWSVAQWLQCDHVAPTAAYPGWRGVIDEQLDALGLQRHIALRCAHFGLMPRMVASGLLVLTTGRQFCQRIIQERPDWGLRIVLPPVAFSPMAYYLLWHDRVHTSESNRWLRDRVKESVSSLNPDPSRT